MRGRSDSRRADRGEIIGRFAKEWIEALEPAAYAICGIRPDELWHMTPAEATAILKAHIKLHPADPMTQRQEPETDSMSPEQIAQRLQMIAGSYGRR